MSSWRRIPWLLLVGAVTALGLGIQLRQAERDRLVSQLRTDLAFDARLLAQAIERVQDRLWATQALFHGSEQVEAHEFAGLAVHIAEHLPWLRAIEWRSPAGQQLRHPATGEPPAELAAHAPARADQVQLVAAVSPRAPAPHALLLAAQSAGAEGTLIFWLDLRRMFTELLGGHDARGERRLFLGNAGERGLLLAALGAARSAEPCWQPDHHAAERLPLADAELTLASHHDVELLASQTSWAPWTAAGVVLLLTIGLHVWRRHQRRLHAEIAAQVALRTAELAAANAALAGSEARAQAFFELGVVGLAELSADGTIQRCNPEFAAMAAVPVDRLVGTPYAALLQPRHAAEFEHRLQLFGSRRQERHTGLVDLQHPSGEKAPVSIGLRAMRAADGSVAALLLAQVDMREFSRMLEELRAAMHLADAASQAKSDFLANMSHELRTPLTAILGFTQILLEAEHDATTREQLHVVARNGEHLLGVLGDILDLAKIEAGHCETRTERIVLRALLDDVLGVLRPRAEAKGVPLRLALDPGTVATLHSDPTRLRQIVFNLVGNAIKFTAEGQVDVRVSTPQAQGRRQLQVEVADTGIGMAAAQIDNLFQPFMQVDTSDRRNFGGTGLGLAISQRLAGLLGGQITVASTPGAGSTFTLVVDAGDAEDHRQRFEPSQATTPPTTAAPTAAQDRTARILVVDDGLDNQQLLRTILQRAGHTVAVAADGEQACREFAAAEARCEPFDLVVMDMQMPVLDGYAATARLRADGARTPILACTARAMPDDRDRCLAAGCDEYVAKPVRPRHLVATVAALLGGPGESIG